MAAADLFVGKPGGLTTSEALSKGLPMVVINPIPGQEERNSDHLLEEGIAIRCNNLPALAYKIDRLIEEPGKLHLMRGNALALARPQAAFTIIDRLDALRAASKGAPTQRPAQTEVRPPAGVLSLGVRLDHRVPVVRSSAPSPRPQQHGRRSGELDHRCSFTQVHAWRRARGREGRIFGCQHKVPAQAARPRKIAQRGRAGAFEPGDEPE